MSTDNRTPRIAETREVTQRKKHWAPASILPDPTAQPGWTFKYIRRSTMGEQDPTNMSKSLREGWETCRLTDHPELQMAVDREAKNSDLVEIGGLILCKMPEEMYKEREAYFANIGNSELESLNAQTMAAQDPRMATMFNERKSSVTFGKGG